MRVERAAGTARARREDPPDAARQDDVQVAPERAHRLARSPARSASTASRCRFQASSAAQSIRLERRCRRIPSPARLAVLGQEVARAADRRARGRPPARPARRSPARRARRGEHSERRSAASIANCGWPTRAVREEQARARRGALAERVARAVRRPPRRRVAASGRAGRLRETAAARAAATSRRSSSAASPSRSRRSPQLREHQRDVVDRSARGARQMRSARSSASPTSRGTSVSSARSKPGSTSASSGNSRSSDRQKASIVEIAMSPSRSRSVAPARRGRAADVRLRLLQPLDDPLPHLGGGLARERDREDVLGLDAGAQQVDVALDEHARLARAGRGLEHDVARRIDRAERARRRQTTSPT